MKLVTYNVNGIRAAMRKDLQSWLKAVNADLVCIQEIKANEDQIDKEVFEELGYEVHLFPAEKKGYSGVALLSKLPINHVELGMGIDEYDSEGRLIRLDFDNFSVMSSYFPSGASKEERQQFKLKFLDDFYHHIQDLKSKQANLIIGGDFNLCHQSIDIHDPYRLDGYPGFTETERNWMSAFLKSGFTDSFRHLNPDPHHYSWWSYRSGARKKNLGWRIDYITVSDSLSPKLQRAYHLTDAMHSDHCPVAIEISI